MVPDPTSSGASVESPSQIKSGTHSIALCTSIWTASLQCQPIYADWHCHWYTCHAQQLKDSWGLHQVWFLCWELVGTLPVSQDLDSAHEKCASKSNCFLQTQAPDTTYSHNIRYHLASNGWHMTGLKGCYPIRRWGMATRLTSLQISSLTTPFALANSNTGMGWLDSEVYPDQGSLPIQSLRYSHLDSCPWLRESEETFVEKGVREKRQGTKTILEYLPFLLWWLG